jgi:apolipoprotein N-acyltransferase
VSDKLISHLKGYGGILLSPVLIMLAFPPFNLGFLSFVYFIPVFFSISGDLSKKERFIKSLIFGLLLFVLLFYWTVITIHKFGRMSMSLSFLLFIPLAIYQMIPFILWLYSFEHLYKKSHFLPALVLPLLTNIFPLIFPYSISSSLAQYYLLPQFADIAGEWGLDFIVILCNILFFAAFSDKNKNKAVLSFAIILFLICYGFIKVNFLKLKFQKQLNIVIIQPVIRDSDNDKIAMKKLFVLIAKAKNISKNKTVILPESSIPDIGVRDDFFKVMNEIKNSLNAKRIIYNHTVYKNLKLYNASIITGEQGIKLYYKNKLMLFGEKFPFHFLIQKLPIYVANFASLDNGTNATPMEDGGVVFATPICLEAVYQNYTAKISKNADLIVNQTNDEWFGKTKATYLHFAQVRLKAIENRKFLIRATNTGYTAVVNPFGKVTASLPTDKPGILQTTVWTVAKKTVFQQISLLLPYLFACLFFILLLSKKEKSNN